jgi:hypothetical protein
MEIVAYIFGTMGFVMAITAHSQTSKLIKELKVLPEDYK